MIIALLLTIILAILNFRPGTFLSGWDTIHSEFNVWLDLKRTIFGVWQEYRGVGVLDGMGHTADLVRQLILLPFSLVLPVETVRYFSQFLWLGVGALGMAWWFDKQILKDQSSLKRFIVSSVVGAAYLLNLGTITNFFLPLESFSIFYAFLPWCLWALFEVLEKAGRRQWLILFLTNVLITPAFYIPTVFIVYSFILSLVTSSYLLVNPHLQTVKRASVAATLVLLVNAFWLLPFCHFVLNASHYPREAQINLMSTEETFLQNKHRGTLKDVALLRGYYYDTKEDDTLLMKPWVDHFEKPAIHLVAYALAILVILGLVMGGKKSLYLAPVLLLTLIALLSNESLVAPLHDLLSNSSPFMAQVFRSPYTKFVVPLVLLYAYYLGLFTSALLAALEKIKLKFFSLAVLIGFLAASVWITKPVFEGQLFAEGIKTQIPHEYFEMFKFFQKQPEDSRIVFLPQYSYWGWNRYEWEYFGSGFIWWGLPQSTMDRAFDGWNSNNENFYWELSRALFAKDQTQFDAVLQKYRVEWLVVDENLTKFYSNQAALGFDEVNALLVSAKYEKQATFGKLRIYKNLQVENGYLESPTEVTGIGSIQKWNDWDLTFEKHGNYIYVPENSGLTWQYLYPYASLFTNKTGSMNQLTFQENQLTYTLATAVPTSAVNSQLVLEPAIASELVDQGYYLQSSIYINDSYQTQFSLENRATVSAQVVASGRITTVLPKLPAEKRSEFINQQLFTETNESKCGIDDGGKTSQVLQEKTGTTQLKLTAINNFDCKDIYLNNTSSAQSYLVNISTSNQSGLPLNFSWIDSATHHTFNEIKLNQNPSTSESYFILPPMNSNKTDYLLSFTNHSYKEFESINQISEVTAQVFPYHTLKSIRFEHQHYTEFGSVIFQRKQRLFSWLYEMTYTPSTNPNTYNVVVLNQAYDSGWILIDLQLLNRNKAVAVHTLFNNWSNAWIIKPTDAQERRILIIFLPQLLAFAGYFLLPVGFISIVLGKKYATA